MAIGPRRSALTNRYSSVEDPAVDGRSPPGRADGRLVISLAVSVIGFVLTRVTLPEPVAPVASLTSERSPSPVAAPLFAPLVRPDDFRMPVSIATDPRLAFPASPSRRLVDRDTHRGQGDTRRYLRDAAAAARRGAWSRPERGETRTDWWINAPESIGSMSPFDPSPGTPSMEK